MEQVLSLSAIRDQKAALNRAILDAQSQLVDLEVAERIVRRFGKQTDDAKPSENEIDDLLVRVDPRPRQRPDGASTTAGTGNTLTSRALVSAVMRQSNSVWMTANEIQERASAIRGSDVPMGTVSPTLSLMKNDGLIARDGLKVALVERLNENGDAPAEPEDRDEGVAAPSHPHFSAQPIVEERQVPA